MLKPGNETCYIVDDFNGEYEIIECEVVEVTEVTEVRAKYSDNTWYVNKKDVIYTREQAEIELINIRLSEVEQQIKRNESERESLNEAAEIIKSSLVNYRNKYPEYFL